jgi:hypothetical protein
MYRKSLLCLIAAGAFAFSCGEDDPPSSGDGGNDKGGSSSGKGGSSSGKGGSSGTNEGGEPGTGGTATGGRGGTAGKGGSATGGDSGSAGAGDGGGGNVVPCEADDPPQCGDSSTILLCDPDADSTLQAFSCDDDFCRGLGLGPGPCVEDGEDTTCRCGEPLDEECYAGAEEICSCLQGTEIECVTDADRFAWYRACLDGEAEEDVVRCFAENSAQACFKTLDQCIP